MIVGLFGCDTRHEHPLSSPAIYRGGTKAALGLRLVPGGYFPDILELIA